VAVRTQSSGGTTYRFDGLADLLAKATPARSGDELAGCAASSDAERAAAQWALADVPLGVFLEELVVPYETDEVTGPRTAPSTCGGRTSAGCPPI